MSASRFSGTTPARLVNPIVDRMPTSAWCDEGPRIELPVSLPRPTGPQFAAPAGAGAPPRPRGHAFGRMRIARVAGEQRVHRLVRAEGELRHVGLGEDDGAGLLDSLDLEGVP